MIDHIIVCANYDKHIIQTPKVGNGMPQSCTYISTLLSANSVGWKREGLKWYCPECVKEKEKVAG